ncbi:DoxX family protein [Paenibacillus caui]|uniref:DoxX family protein n=1 Tax=Paenibacillus caui TaxID=2873927 RepID=UPI001CA9E79E
MVKKFHFKRGGFKNPATAVVLVLTMLMAIFKVHIKNGFWNTSGGYEFNLILIAVLVGIALIGAGSLSIDALL